MRDHCHRWDLRSPFGRTGSKPHIDMHDAGVQISQRFERSDRQVDVPRPGVTASAAVDNSDEYTFVGTVAD